MLFTGRLLSLIVLLCLWSFLIFPIHTERIIAYATSEKGKILTEEEFRGLQNFLSHVSRPRE
jgi:hypothetical protein